MCIWSGVSINFALKQGITELVEIKFMSLLESTTKFAIKNPRSTRIFEEKEFFNWSNNNFYRTSYNDMGDVKTKVSLTHFFNRSLSKINQICLGL
jgi:hypothetical protein